jgi:hypothetical protein
MKVGGPGYKRPPQPPEPTEHAERAKPPGPDDSLEPLNAKTLDLAAFGQQGGKNHEPRRRLQDLKWDRLRHLPDNISLRLGQDIVRY